MLLNMVVIILAPKITLMLEKETGRLSSKNPRSACEPTIKNIPALRIIISFLVFESLRRKMSSRSKRRIENNTKHMIALIRETNRINTKSSLGYGSKSPIPAISIPKKAPNKKPTARLVLKVFAHIPVG